MCSLENSGSWAYNFECVHKTTNKCNNDLQESLVTQLSVMKIILDVWRLFRSNGRNSVTQSRGTLVLFHQTGCFTTSGCLLPLFVVASLDKTRFSLRETKNPKHAARKSKYSIEVNADLKGLHVVIQCLMDEQTLLPMRTPEQHQKSGFDLRCASPDNIDDDNCWEIDSNEHDYEESDVPMTYHDNSLDDTYDSFPYDNTTIKREHEPPMDIYMHDSQFSSASEQEQCSDYSEVTWELIQNVPLKMFDHNKSHLTTRTRLIEHRDPLFCHK